MRIKPLLLAVLASLLLVTTGFWYVGYANRTHPAPWPMALGDAARRNYARAPFPQSPKLLWSYPVGDTGVGRPVAGVDGTIYLPIAEGVTAIGPDGKRRWTWRSDTVVYDLALGRHGTVYAHTQKALYALGPDGAMQWQTPLDSAPVGLLLVGQGGVVYAQTRTYLYAVSDSGVAKWRFRWRDPQSVTAEMPDGRVLAVDGTTLYAIKPDGDLSWQKSVGTVANFYALTVGTDGLIYLRNSGLVLLDASGTLISDNQIQLPAAMNLAKGKDFLQVGYARFSSNGSRVWTGDSGAMGAFVWVSVDSDGNALLIQPDADLATRTPPNLTLLGADGKVRWRFSDLRPVSLPAFTRDGRICVVGHTADEAAPKLACIGND